MGARSSTPSETTEKKETKELPKWLTDDTNFLPIDKAKQIEPNTAKISILSYNILADTYCDGNYFRSSDPMSLDFGQRAPKIVNTSVALSIKIPSCRSTKLKNWMRILFAYRQNFLVALSNF